MTEFLSQHWPFLAIMSIIIASVVYSVKKEGRRKESKIKKRRDLK